MTVSAIQLFRLSHTSGAYVDVSNLGASWISCMMPDKDGCMGEILLGYPDMNDYARDTNYMGRTIGRFANRIKGASFSLDGKDFYLDKNDGANCNHSGATGFHGKLFTAERLSSASVRFSCESQDGEGGFPGKVTLAVTYTLQPDLKLVIDYDAVTTASTPLSITNHAYFNLDGEGDIFSHQLRLFSRQMLEADEQFIPTGKILDILDSPFDFSEGKSIGQDISEENVQFVWNRGYNHCYLFPADGCLHPMAELSSPKSGRKVSFASTLPAMQLYSGGFLSSSSVGRFGRLVQPSDGVAMEAQFCPDSPNQPAFPSCILHPGERYHHRIEYVFSVI